MTRSLLFLLAGLLVVPPSAAQDELPFSFGGEIRHRSELDARDFKNDPVSFHLLRTRLNGQFDATDDIDVFVQVQDSRLFGDGDPARGRGTLDAEAGELDLHQAYFEIRNLLDAPLRLRVGRQELVYGNQRLVGAVGWSNVGRTFDAGRLTYEGERVTADLFAARLVDSLDTDDDAQNFFGLYTTWPLGDAHELDAFVLLDNNQTAVPTGENETENRLVRVTPGLALRGTVAPVEYEVEFAYQGGRRALEPGAPRATVDATFFGVRTAYTARPATGLRFEAGYARLSGDDPADDDFGQFDTLFATNHKFYGFMDFFPATLTRFGLQDAFVTASRALTEQIDADLAIHHFRTAEAVAGPRPGLTSQTLGQEVDVTVTYRPESNVQFTAGMSGFFGGDAMEVAFDDGGAYWGYLMSTIQF